MNRIQEIKDSLNILDCNFRWLRLMNHFSFAIVHFSLLLGKRQC